jgi:hypothetical protein
MAGKACCVVIYLGAVTEDYNGAGPTTMQSTHHSIDEGAYLAARIQVVKD